MKLQWLAPLALGMLVPVAHADGPVLKTEEDKASYAVGVDMGRNLRSVGANVQVEPMMRGLRDGLSGAKPVLSDPQIHQLMAAYRADLGRKQQVAMQRVKMDNQEKGDKFVDAYKKRDGVIALPDGLMYRVLKAGSGGKPAESDTVAINYSARLVDGTQFDASEPGKPARFKLNAGVIQGMRDALEQMQAGSKWEVVMPPALAYGDRGGGPEIPPAATLVFDIELVSISQAAVSNPSSPPAGR
jgi:FKBP-type peptidyl-prolyl cis-trans isomerase